MTPDTTYNQHELQAAINCAVSMGCNPAFYAQHEFWRKRLTQLQDELVRREKWGKDAYDASYLCSKYLYNPDIGNVDFISPPNYSNPDTGYYNRLLGTWI